MMRRAAVVLAVAVLASGCATTRAQAPVYRPVLDVPPAPPRVIESAPPPQFAGQEPVPELPPEEPPPPPPVVRARPAATRETQKPEIKPEAPAQDTAAAAPELQAAPPVPVPLLRTPATVDTAAAERQIRDTLERADKGLKSVDYQRLSDARKRWYDEAKDFITSSAAAIKALDLELAKELADKAEKYARELR